MLPTYIFIKGRAPDLRRTEGAEPGTQKQIKGLGVRLGAHVGPPLVRALARADAGPLTTGGRAQRRGWGRWRCLSGARQALGFTCRNGESMLGS